MIYLKKLILIIVGMAAFINLTAQEAGSEIVLILPGGVSVSFLYIPPGEFIMGSGFDEKDRDADEDPVRKVILTEGFYLGKYEVTQGQWNAVMKNNPSVFQDKVEWQIYPVDNVSWNDCMAFIDSLNRLNTGIFRLPTEAEWEYACRAGTTTRYYWGEDPDDQEVYQYAWAFSRAEGRSHPVGTKDPNAWGLFDMSGNVWEWCSDWRGDYVKSDTINPKGSPDGTKKIYRGGSWFNRPSTLRSANRNGHEPNTKGSNAGLRLVMEAGNR